MIERNVFITGGDKGIGEGIATVMASEYRNVIITYNRNRTGAERLSNRFGNISFFQCDLGDVDSIKGVGEEILTEYGGIDILVNNAGYEKDAIFSKMSRDDWESVIRINLESIFHFTQLFSRRMVENNWGRIINLTSIAGYTGAFGKSNYAAAKAGIVGFTKSIAMELGKKNICVNAIAPGAICTDMLMRIPAKYRDRILENIPSNRFGRVEDIAYLVQFLASDKASYINGQTIHVNGGSFAI